jgi:hypothetical protein
LLGLPVWGGDIRNAYLQAPSSEKHFIICGPEFRLEYVGCVALVCHALMVARLQEEIFGTTFGIVWAI